uniref:Uncharacterized protein n=1 Tax=Macaca fascicularis TaxID=9541 RepID=A0A7N9CB96_MACFA
MECSVWILFTWKDEDENNSELKFPLNAIWKYSQWFHFSSPLKEYWHRNSPAVPAEAKRNRKTNGSSPETSTSAGCHSAQDSPCQEQAVVLDSRSVKISRLNNTIKSLEQQKKQVEHQLEEVTRFLCSRHDGWV